MNKHKTYTVNFFTVDSFYYDNSIIRIYHDEEDFYFKIIVKNPKLVYESKLVSKKYYLGDYMEDIKSGILVCSSDCGGSEDSKIKLYLSKEQKTDLYKFIKGLDNE